MADIKYFSFFESYYKALKNLPPEVVGEVVLLMGDYFFTGQEIPERDGITGAVLELIRPSIGNSKARSDAAKKQTGNKTETNGKQNGIKTESNEEQTGNKTETNGKQTGNYKDKGIYIRNNKEKEYKEKEKRFAPPSLDEVSDYCRERNNTVDPHAFVDFYTSKGWKVGNQPMKDWKAAVRTWERNRQRASPKTDGTKFSNFEEHKYDYGDLEKRFARN